MDVLKERVIVEKKRERRLIPGLEDEDKTTKMTEKAASEVSGKSGRRCVPEAKWIKYFKDERVINCVNSAPE